MPLPISLCPCKLYKTKKHRPDGRRFHQLFFSSSMASIACRVSSGVTTGLVNSPFFRHSAICCVS